MRPDQNHKASLKGNHAHRSARWSVRIVMEGLPLQASSVLLSRGDQHILVDTGFPIHDTILKHGLSLAGVQPDQITGIINTHFHFDHIGGNSHFPAAWVYGSRKDYEWAVTIYESVCGGEERRSVFRTFYPEATDADFDEMDNARLLQFIRWMWEPGMLGDLGRYRWLEDGPIGIEGLTIVPTPGHTPGHCCVEVDGEDGQYLILGDARAFGDEANGMDMPPHCRRDFLRSRALVDQFEGILIPGHDQPFRQSGQHGVDDHSQERATRSAAERQERPSAAERQGTRSEAKRPERRSAAEREPRLRAVREPVKS